MFAETGAHTEYRIERFEELESTNDEALRRGRAGCEGGLWIVARRQSRGRGRLGRAWASPEGNLYASLLIVDPCDARHAPELGFVAGVALARTVRSLIGGADARIKWPNDIVCGGAKLAGVLVEGTRTAEGRFVSVLGFGVNCLAHPTGLPYPTTSLLAAGAEGVTVDRLLSSLSTNIGEVLRSWDRGRNFPAIRRAWLGAALPAGVGLTVRTASTTLTGRFVSIDDRGRLMIDTAGGPATVEAGDAFLNTPVEAAERI